MSEQKSLFGDFLKPERQPARLDVENNDGEQRVLFAGLDCLPGQLDLFATDGKENK